MDYTILFVIQQYINYYLVGQRNSPRTTVLSYTKWLMYFYKFAWDIPVKQINKVLIEKYRYYLMDQGIKTKTTNAYLVALRQLFHYCKGMDIETISPQKIQLWREQKQPIIILSEEEILRLLVTPKNIRDRAILSFLYSTGVRVSELTSCVRNAIDMDNRSISLVGKGNKMRVIYFSEHTRDLLITYLWSRTDNSPYVFVTESNNCKGEKISSTSIQKLVREYAKKVGITKKVSPHTIRHTSASHMHAKGVQLSTIQRLYGHSHMSTTTIYTHQSDAELKREHGMLFSTTNTIL